MISLIRQRHVRPFLATLGLLGLLVAIGTLQYRALNRVSNGERELMRQNLQARSDGFRQDFDREVTRAYLAFHVNADAVSYGVTPNVSAQFNAWSATAPYPRLVKEVYFIRRAENGFTVSRFDRASGYLEPADWPPEFARLRERIDQQEESTTTFTGLSAVFEDVPLLVSTVAPIASVKEGLASVDWQHPFGYVVIWMDSDYIRSNFIPSLARRYFADRDSYAFDLAVRSHDRPHDIIFTTDPHTIYSDTPSGEGSGDVVVNFFTIDVAGFRNSQQQPVYRASSPADVPSPPARNNLTVVVPQTRSQGNVQTRITSVIGPSPRWMLVVKHPAESLEAAITKSRRWNLALNFAILLLLATSVLLIAFSSRRAHGLAQRQMEFVAGVSHEFRTPLAAIQSLSENLAAGRVREEDRIRQYGSTIWQDVQRLSEMIEQVLQFAGADRRNRFFNLEPLNVGRLVESVLAANRTAFAKAGWCVEEEIEADLPLVLGDESALTRVLQNLISNALKYGGGKALWLRVTADTDRPRRMIKISVADHGPGISAKDLPHVFEPFYRAQDAVDAQIHGSGLGLSLVKQIVEAHSGRVTIETTLAGAKFILQIPFCEQASGSKAVET